MKEINLKNLVKGIIMTNKTQLVKITCPDGHEHEFGKKISRRLLTESRRRGIPVIEIINEIVLKYADRDGIYVNQETGFTKSEKVDLPVTKENTQKKDKETLQNKKDSLPSTGIFHHIYDAFF